MSRVFVLDTEKRPLMPCTPARARVLLKQHKAAVWRHYPFTIILQQSLPEASVCPLRLKIDPGSKTTGVALVNDTTGEVVAAQEITHRGQQIRMALQTRRQVRLSRRFRHTRYRQVRFANRRRPKGWLPPSVKSRVINVLTWAKRLCRFCPIAVISMERVKFDTQLLQNAEISGVAYQQGTLSGYEVRDYLLEKWQRRCVYCKTTDIPLQIEHIVPKSRGGTDRVSNLTLSCEVCNTRKGTMTASEFGYDEVQARAKIPLKDAAAMNAIRYVLHEQLMTLALPIEVSTGGRTKWNRARRGLPKTHWLDAACVGESTPETLYVRKVMPLRVVATGRQWRQMCQMNGFGFPHTNAKKTSNRHNFRTGDIVRAVVPLPLKTAGVHAGRAVVKANGQMKVATRRRIVSDVSYRYCTLLQKNDGYAYT